MKKVQWNEVTWYSRAGALVLFLIIIPILAFNVGMKYQEVQDLEGQVKVIPSTHAFLDTTASVAFATSTFSVAHIDFNLRMPLVTVSDVGVQRKINKSIQTDIASIEAKYQKDIADAPCKDAKGFMCQTAIEVTGTTSISQRFHILSIEYTVFISSEQMAHPDLEIEQNRIYDLGTGEEKKYNEIAGMNAGDLLVKISEISRKKLKSQFGVSATDAAHDAFVKGTEPTEENFSHIMIDETGLRIHFSYYQIGPRPYGAPEVTISFKELGI